MDFINLLGYAAGTLTTGAFIPQVVKAWKTKSTKDLSQSMFIIFCTGVFLWLLYGITIRSFPVIIANIVVFILAVTILYLKLKYS